MQGSLVQTQAVVLIVTISQRSSISIHACTHSCRHVQGHMIGQSMSLFKFHLNLKNRGKKIAKTLPSSPGTWFPDPWFYGETVI